MNEKQEKKTKTTPRKQATPTTKRERPKKQAPSSYTSIFGDENDEEGGTN